MRRPLDRSDTFTRLSGDARTMTPERPSTIPHQGMPLDGTHPQTGHPIARSHPRGQAGDNFRRGTHDTVPTAFQHPHSRPRSTTHSGLIHCKNRAFPLVRAGFSSFGQIHPQSYPLNSTDAAAITHNPSTCPVDNPGGARHFLAVRCGLHPARDGSEQPPPGGQALV